MSQALLELSEVFVDEAESKVYLVDALEIRIFVQSCEKGLFGA